MLNVSLPLSVPVDFSLYVNKNKKQKLRCVIRHILKGSWLAHLCPHVWSPEVSPTLTLHQKRFSLTMSTVMKAVVVKDKYLIHYSSYLRYLLYFQILYFQILILKIYITAVLWYNGEQTSTHAHVPPALKCTHQLPSSCVRAKADVGNIEKLCHNGWNGLNWMLHLPASQADDFLLTNRLDYCN